MGLDEELTRIADAASAHAAEGETLAGVLAAEPASGARVFLCAFERPDDARSWLALDEGGAPVAARSLVREAASIAALCEIAGDAAGGGDLPALRARLLELRLTEAPAGIAEAEDAALALERAIGSPPRVASASYLDAVGTAARRLEEALGDSAHSPFLAAMQAAVGAAEELAADVEAHYKLDLG